MTVEKVSLSLDPDVVAEAREYAGRGGLSALVNEALRIRLQQVRISHLLDQMDDEFGSVPDDVVEEVGHRWRKLDEAG